LLATALVLQTYDVVPDEEAKLRAHCDRRWKVALGLEVETRELFLREVATWLQAD
jgi:hypothetical protein